MEPIWQAELALLEQMQQVPFWIIQFFKGVTFFGEESFYMILIPIFYWSINMQLGYRFTLLLMLSNWINGFFKMLFHFPRPFWLSSEIKAYVTETSFGLPSGHSTNAASVWLFLARKYKNYPWIAGGFCLLVLLIMISRLFLGMHFFSDILSGFLLGVALLIVFLWLNHRFASTISNQSTTTKLWISLATTLVFLLIGLMPIWTNTFQLPEDWISRASQATQGVVPSPFSIKGVVTLAGVWLGMNLGYTLLQKSSHPMQTNGTLIQHVIRLLIGLTIAMGIRFGLGALFSFASGPLLYCFDFIRYTAIAFWIAFPAPWVFLKLNLYKKRIIE